MKKCLQSLLFVFALYSANNAVAQNQVYWREGFEPSATPACDLGTVKPTAFTPGYFNGNAGVWYSGGVYRTTGTGCPAGNNHVRLSNFNTAGPDSNFMVTPIVDFGIQEFHFLRARASRSYTIWITSDTSATTTNWTQPTTLKSWGNPLCVDTTVIIASATAKRLKIVTKFGIDADIDSVILTSFAALTPVKFGGVSAAEANGMVKLNWNIETELNTNSYVIERAIGGDKYVAVGTIGANRLKSYSWIDKAANAGANYYRIKAIDNNGTYMYSSAVKIVLGKNRNAELSVYPNPVANSKVNLQLTGITTGEYKLNFYSINGALVYTTSVSSQGSSLAKSIDLPNVIKTGAYTLEVTNGSFRTVKTILIN